MLIGMSWGIPLWIVFWVEGDGQWIIYLWESLQFGRSFPFHCQLYTCSFWYTHFRTKTETRKETMGWKTKHRMNEWKDYCCVVVGTKDVLWMTRRKRWEMQILFLFLYFIKASHSTLKITLYSSIFKVSLCLHYLHTTLCLHPRNRYHLIVRPNQSYNASGTIAHNQHSLATDQRPHRPRTNNGPTRRVSKEMRLIGPECWMSDWASFRRVLSINQDHDWAGTFVHWFAGSRRLADISSHAITVWSAVLAGVATNHSCQELPWWR